MNMHPIVEVSPHQKGKLNTPSVMKQVAVGLIPAMIASIVFFKLSAFFVIITCVLGCVLSEWFVFFLRKKPHQLGDYSAVVTGVLLALVLPPKTPLWCAFLGAVVSIIIGKHLFGGLGQNIFNPALVGRAFLMASFPVILSTWNAPFTLDAVTSATPLASWKFSGVFVSLRDLFIGSVSGSLGETSAIALILGGIYLFIRKIADWRAPLGMLLGIVVLAEVFYLLDPANGSVLFHLLSGGVILGMFFMITDPVTTPVTKRGRIIFGLAVGFLVIIIRKWAGLPEGVMYSILFMNAFVPIINKLTKSRVFGK